MHHNLKIRQNYKASNMPTVVENIRKKDVQTAFFQDAQLVWGLISLLLNTSTFLLTHTCRHTSGHKGNRTSI